MAELGFSWEDIGYGNGGNLAPGATSASSARANAIYEAPTFIFPPLAVADEWLAMNGSLNNGGSFEGSPSILASFFGSNNQGAFDVDLGGVSGRMGAGTLAVIGIAGAAIVAFLLFRRRG